MYVCMLYVPCTMLCEPFSLNKLPEVPEYSLNEATTLANCLNTESENEIVNRG